MEFLKLKGFSIDHSFYVIDNNRSQIAGHIHFHDDGNVARSPVVAPFGSFEFDTRVPGEVMMNFIEFVEQHLRQRNVKKVVLKNPPEGCNSPVNTILQTLLVNLGYSISTAEVGSVIDLRSIAAFDEVVHPRKRRKLHQSQLAEGFEFRDLDHQFLKQVYQFIAGIRETKAYKLSITLDELEKTFAALPNDYNLFGVFQGPELIAASISVRITDKILYHFISDYLRTVDNVRPGLLLMDGIVRYCKEEGMDVLDLGTSATDGKPNFSLIDYKTELGGSLTSKFTFEKQLSN